MNLLNSQVIQFRKNIRLKQTCAVCSEETHNSFYGVISCDACRTFFRRKVLADKVIFIKNLTNNFTDFYFMQILVCLKSENCKPQGPKGRISCSLCRFQKCLSVGMRSDQVMHEVVVRTSSGGKKKAKKPRKPSERNTNSPASDSSTSTELLTEEMYREDFYVMRAPSSTVQYKVIGMKVIPSYSWQIMVEVPVKDGVIVGTNCVFNRLLENRLTLATVSSESSLVLESRFNDTLFRKDSEPTSTSNDSFNVEVTDLNSGLKIILQSMTDNHWDRLKRVVMASKCFLQCSEAQHYLPESESMTVPSIAGETVQRRLILLSNTENYSKPITSGVEAFDAYQSLPLEDQLILLKDGVVEVGLVLTLLEYDSTSNTFIATCLDGHLLFCVHLDNFKEDATAEPLYQLLSKVYSEFFNFLHKDVFLIHLLAVIVFFRTREGLSSPEIIERERLLFMEILEKYIEAKVRSGHWKTSVEDICYNIHHLMKQVKTVNSVYTELATAIESKSNEGIS